MPTSGQATRWADLPRERFKQHACEIAALMAPGDAPRAAGILGVMHNARNRVLWERNIAAARGDRHALARLARAALVVAARRRALVAPAPRTQPPHAPDTIVPPGSPAPSVLPLPRVLHARAACSDDPPPPRCSSCGRPADTVHALPWLGKPFRRVALACPSHDPGGYWLDVADYADHRARLLGKRGAATAVSAMDSALGWTA